MALSEHEFEALVGDALDELPPFFQQLMDNVVILFEQQPSPRTLRDMGMHANDELLGLYEGIPLTERTQGYNMVPPDTITLFQRPIESAAGDPDDPGFPAAVREQVRQTVIHEIAHHFGISDERLIELGAY